MIGFTKRNLKVFYRDSSVVFFSLLASFITIGLYILFLGDVYTADYETFPNARSMMDSWVMAGLLATTSVTAAMGAFGTMVNDKAGKIIKDFFASPISRPGLAGGYVLSAYLIGLVMSVITLIFAELFIYINGGSLLSPSSMLKVFLLILAADFSNTAMIFFLTSFFTSSNAFSTATTVIGTLIGFITGIYLPIGMLPEPVQWLVKLFPASHAAALLRQIMMEDSMSAAFAGAPVKYLEEYKNTFGVTYLFGDHILSNWVSIIILLGSGTVFFILAVIHLSHEKKA